MASFQEINEKAELLKERAKTIILKNFEANDSEFIPLSYPHYPDQILWESGANSIIAHELDLDELARNEILRALEFQQQEGWIPNIMCKSNMSKFRKKFSNSFFGINKKENRCFSFYSQPSILATALEWINDPELAKKTLPKVARFYFYFIKSRDIDNDNLPSLVHPHEISRDASPEWDSLLKQWFIPKAGKINLLLHYLAIFKLNLKCKKYDWNPEKILENHIFDVEDVQFLSLLIDELRTMTRLISNKKEINYVNQIADKIKDALITLCWDEEDKFFYSLDWQNKKIRVKTIGGFFPLLLRDLPKEIVDSLVEHLKNLGEFWTKYPIPTVSKNYKRFNSQGSHGLLRGASWIYWNWNVVRGLLRHGYKDLALEIMDNDFKKIEENEKIGGFREFYNPFNGKGLRNVTKNFSTSTLPITYPTLFLKETRKA